MNARRDLFLITHEDSGTYKLQGEMSFASSESAFRKTEKIFSVPVKVVFDLSEIRKVDSAGLALMLEWLQMARQRGSVLHFIKLPSQLLNLAQVVGIEDMLITGSTT